MTKPTFEERYGPWICAGCGRPHKLGEDCPPTIDEQIAELKAAGWIPLTQKCWKAPAGSGCAGCFLGPHGAWKAVKRRESLP